ncbi:MAG TPA: DUF2061 domain-containing protein [Bacteroidia bacterium]|nr:DUF2061 domain-containing protein [Bacteroidia bacterium]
MLIDLFRKENLKLEAKSHKVSVLKAITWRILGTIDTIIISSLLTGNIKIGLGIGGIEVLSKMLLYYLHERAWMRLVKK